MSRIVTCMIGVLVIILGAVLLTTADDQAKNPDERFLLRQTFQEGRVFRYRITLAGEGEWRPEINGLHNGKLSTEMLFDLKTKTIRDNDLCTFELLAQELESTIATTKRIHRIKANRKDFDVRGPRLSVDIGKENPLTEEMTMTFDSRGRFRYGTGYRHIGRFFTVSVDRRFWDALTTAPLEAIGVGDEWTVNQPLRLPDTRGKEAEVKVSTKVTGWKAYRGVRCLVVRSTADLKLEETTVIFKNGDRLHVTAGRYQAEGEALWDPAKGVLCHARAKNSLVFEGDKPERRSFAGSSQCALELVSIK